jgi:hypothetical protein
MTTIRFGNSHNIPNFLGKDVKRAACLNIMLDERCTTLDFVPLHFLLSDQNSTQIIIKVFLFTNECTSECPKNNIKIYMKIGPTFFGAGTPSSRRSLSVLFGSRLLNSAT